MKLERFAYFLAVAQTGSITLGAQKSFITQTAMSRRWRRWKRNWGCRC